MMPSRKDNLYIIRMRGSISSVKPRWWESKAFPLSSTRYSLLRFLFKEVKVPWSICLLKCFKNMVLNTDIWCSFSTVKLMKVSFQESTQEWGEGRTLKQNICLQIEFLCLLSLTRVFDNQGGLGLGQVSVAIMFNPPLRFLTSHMNS